VNRRMLIVGAVVVMGLSGFLFFGRGSKAPEEKRAAADPNVVELSPEAQKNAALVVEEATERQIQGFVKTTGIVAPDQARVGHVFPLARGIVEKVYVQLGDKVTEGQPLVLYDNIELGQLLGEYLSLRGGLSKLQAQENVASKSLERARALIGVQAIAQSQFDVRQAEDEQARAAVQSQRADVARVEEQLHRFGLSDQDIGNAKDSEHGSHRTASHNILKAPRSGVITKFDVSQGEVVEREKELLTIVDTSVVWVLGDIYEKDLAAVRTGGEARITVASYPDERFSGRITYVSDFLDPASRTAKVRCVVENLDRRLKLEMFANVEVPAVGARLVLAIPADAIQKMDSEEVVFVQRDSGRYEKRVVQTGERAGGWVELPKGVGKGEKVVTKGSFYVKSALLREQIGGEE
jgi:cobalt-zinc-cadmium efflux system membrane fusion protein